MSSSCCTWQVFTSDGGKNYRWQCFVNNNKPPIHTLSPLPTTPPSISDLLFQGYSNLLDNQNAPTVVQDQQHINESTGLGKPVAIKPSSVDKARSIFGDINDDFVDTRYSNLLENQNAPTVDDQQHINQSTANTGYSTLEEEEEDGSNAAVTPFTFRTGLGKPVAIKQSSVEKARSIFGDNNDDFVDTRTECLKVHEDKADTPLTFQTGSGKLVAAKKSSFEKAFAILGDLDDETFSDWAGGTVGQNDGTNCLNTMFQTASGKAVNICSNGLTKARTLLGIEESFDHDKASKDLNKLTKNANAGEFFTCQTSSSPQMTNAGTNLGFQESKSAPVSKFKFQSASRPPPIKFQTAGGRSVKVSGDALKRARSLLGDPDLGNFLKEGDGIFSCSKNGSFGDKMLNKENIMCTSFGDDMLKQKKISNNFISPVRSTLSNKKSAVRLESVGFRSNLIKEFDEVEHDINIKKYNDVPCSLMPSTAAYTPHVVGGVRGRKSFNGPLADISNTIGLVNADNKQVNGEKRKPSIRKYPSPFKKPRISKFIPPLNKTVVSNGTIPKAKASEESFCKRRISTRYPFQIPRKYIKEYLKEPPSFQNTFKLPEWLKKTNSENAEKHMFEDESGLKCIGVDSFFHVLAQSGCSTLSKEWIANHYRWIVWKLACYERCYPAKLSGKLLTASNVLEELKYRYEREVNNGHRSALKRILEGDAPPSSPVVLCIASINLKCNAESDTDCSTVASIELTDGWYSVKGLLDELLLKQLVTGKLCVGQKLRICGAGLCGWDAPVTPLEASRMISLCLHLNGTYRAHWADRLGFCKTGCAPLAFKCIKGSGGVVPSTLVGITRIYPILYRERLGDGGFVVRSERMESKRMQWYDHRRSNIVEGVMSEFQKGLKTFKCRDEKDIGEGEKISLLLEQAAEPEILMADMSSEQLTSFASYQAKIEETRQSEMQKSIEKALEDAGLSKREVNTFMRVRVVGLTSNKQNTSRPRQGLITIWNPTEKQQSELVEGQAYAVAGLTPINSDSDTIYMRARGSTEKWKPLSPSIIQQFRPFYSPRKPVTLLKMGQVPLSSEFDVAAFVIYVGEVHKSGNQKRQWVFVADGSISLSHQHDLSDALLAISFSSPSIDCDSVVPINYNLVGSTVCAYIQYNLRRLDFLISSSVPRTKQIIYGWLKQLKTLHTF
ncbi:BRCA2, oligonucleotide/oligosaccharide-binding 1 [Artemisia annua]|uniref:BRCA2, oligonucleotide/oligosaccharide-binding 1 n=1 Tax=Artemisia annua TaxID=35608 RepID=A0A2U1PST0_ARTAN|nr:BRCA2, oligonucleotide/oligosaccharide-binding 1 [Artemisia annua]